MAILPRFYVYILARPDGRPFYVGKGSGSRLFDHDAEARSGHDCHKCNVIRKIWRAGGEVQRYTVFTTDSENEAYAYEQEQIDLIGRENLTNATDGGVGGRGRVVSQAERDLQSQLAKERYADPALHERRRAERKIHWSDPANRDLQSKHIRARWDDPEQRAKMVAGIRAGHNTPEARAKKRTVQEERWADQSLRDSTSEYWKSQWSDPEYRARRTFERACAQCNEVFSAITVTAKFCSERCKHRYYRRKKDD